MKRPLLLASLALCSHLSFAQAGSPAAPANAGPTAAPANASPPAAPANIDAAHHRKGWTEFGLSDAPLHFNLSSPSEPAVIVDNIAIAHEQKGWRVVDVAPIPIHFNLMKGDLIVRIEGKNASETGPMQMASLLNEGYTQAIHLFIERGDFRMETRLREIPTQDYTPVGRNPFRHVAPGFSAPEAEFRDLDDQPMTLDQFKDQWLLIDFMGTWCPPCMRRLPGLLSIVDRHHLSLLMVTISDKPDSVRRMKQQYNIHAPIAMVQQTSELPIEFGIMTDHWTGQIPGLVLIRPDGEVALVEMGGSEKEELEKTLETLMTKSANGP